MELEQQDGSRTLCGKPGFFVTSIIKHLSDKRDNAILMSLCPYDFLWISQFVIMTDTKRNQKQKHLT